MKRKYTPYIYILFLWGSLLQVSAQEVSLEVFTERPENKVFVSQLHYQHRLDHEHMIPQQIDSIYKQLNALGFLHPTIRHNKINDSTINAHIHLGNQLTHALLKIPPNVFTDKELKELPGKLTQNQLSIAFTQTQNALQQIAHLLDQRGETFSTVRLTKISINGSLLRATLAITQTAPRRIDKISIQGYPELSKGYIKQYLGLEIGQTFKKSDLLPLYEQLNTIPFIRQLKAPQVLFTKDTTHLYLFLQKQMVNQFDGLIGFTSKETGGGLQFNGHIDLALQNVFNGGEAIQLSWKNNGNEQQQLKLDIKTPYFLQTKFTPAFHFNVFKQDSTYVNSTTEMTLGYALKFNHAIGLSAEWEKSTSNTNQLPTPNYTHFYLGAFYQHSIPSFTKLYPQKAQLAIHLHTGKRTITSSEQQTRIRLSGSYIWQVSQQHHVYLANVTQWLSSDTYLQNELFRIGGANSIRGFNEDQFFSNAYSYVNLEYRFAPNNDTYFYSITDFGSAENKNALVSTKFYSFGLGYVIQTKMGLVNLSYAVGGITKQALTLNDSRLHIKFVTNF